MEVTEDNGRAVSLMPKAPRLLSGVRQTCASPQEAWFSSAVPRDTGHRVKAGPVAIYYSAKDSKVTVSHRDREAQRLLCSHLHSRHENLWGLRSWVCFKIKGGKWWETV